MFKRISEEEEKTPSDGPEVFIPVIIHSLFSFRRSGMVRGVGWGGAVEELKTEVAEESVGLFD